MNRLLQLVLCAALLTATALASDTAILRNGFSILHQRREIIGFNTRLYIDGDPSNFVDIPTAEIDRFESVPDAPKSPNQLAPNLLIKIAATTPAPFDLNQTVQSVSGTYQLDPDLVTSVIRAESGFNVHARSPKGAQGLMQLMPQTATQLGVQNAYDPQANVEAGTRYLRQLLERYNFDLIKALAAYNAGPERVEQYNGVPPYYETKAYVARIIRDFNKKKLAAKSAAPSATNSVAVNAAATRKTSAAKLSSARTATKPASTVPIAQN